ncbi:PaRep2a protein, partial [Pyrobaculum sp.]|uniref:PaRep2a protein n=1 Tax=Pyrobaculum sp. TaxID=2004705 RepID=UPI003160FD39
IRAIDYIKNEEPRVLEWRKKEEQRRLELKSQVMAALKDWYRRCFKWPIMPGEEGKLVRRIELYYGMCEMAKTAIAEYGEKYAEPLISEYALRKAFWWEGEWRGKSMSCFVTEKKAVCKVGDKMATFYVFDTPQGVYLRPEIKLVDDWIKVAYRGDDS